MGHCNLSCEAYDVELSATSLQNKKKRKRSKIVWDRDEVSNLYCSNNNGISSRKKSTNVLSTGGFRILTKEDRPVPQVKSVVDVVSGDGLSSFLLDGHNKLEFEDCARSHNIGSCRWVNYAADESVIPDAPTDQGFLKRKQKSREKSYVSDKGSNRSSCSRTNKFAKKDLGNDHYMETNEERNNGDTNGRHLNNNSQDECSFCDTPEPAAPLQRKGNVFQTCRSIDEFESLKQIGEGTYGIVYKAKNKITGETVALKKFKMDDNDNEGFPLTTLREINILHSLNHSSIIGLKEVVVGTGDYIFLVMECMDHDLKAVMDTKKQPFGQSVIKRLMLQLLEGVKYLHHNWILHRDLKPSNLLINSRNELKICDLGMARQCGTPSQPYTEVIVTLWYRAPELLLGKKQYSSAIDMWSVGCIMAELLLNRPLFNGITEIDQINKIFRILGTPNETSWPGFSKLPKGKVKFVEQPDNLLRKKFPATSFTGSPALSNAGFDLLSKLLTYDPEKRMTADEALNHQWFREVTFSQV